jgi:hypothetical protein
MIDMQFCTYLVGLVLGSSCGFFVGEFFGSVPTSDKNSELWFLMVMFMRYDFGVFAQGFSTEKSV